MQALLRTAAWRERAALIELGLNHEQQHQELILTDIKHLFSRNPQLPAYGRGVDSKSDGACAPGWRAFPAGVREIGHFGGGFAFDNEQPRHRVFADAFEIADRLVSPLLRWQTRAALASAVTREREAMLTEAASIIRTVASSLAPERSAGYLAAPQVVEVLEAAG